jgi:hypothetical protein
MISRPEIKPHKMKESEDRQFGKKNWLINTPKQ